MRARAWWKTAIGIVLTAIMLFPIYWMINVSLTKAPNLRKSPPNLIPLDPTFEGYQRVLQRAAPVPRHEPADRNRHRAADARAMPLRPHTPSPSCGLAAETR